MNDYRECDHVAPVCGVRTVFASIEFPAEQPPREIVIAGYRYVRRDADDCER